MDKSMEIPKKIKSRTTMWSSYFTSVYLSDNMKTLIWKEIYVPHHSIIYNSQDMKAA